MVELLDSIGLITLSAEHSKLSTTLNTKSNMYKSHCQGFSFATLCFICWGEM